MDDFGIICRSNVYRLTRKHPVFFYETVICAIATVILNVILLRICIVGINKQREEESMQPTLWPYALIIIYIFAIPGGFIYVILLEIGVI